MEKGQRISWLCKNMQEAWISKHTWAFLAGKGFGLKKNLYNGSTFRKSVCTDFISTLMVDPPSSSACAIAFELHYVKFR